MDRLLHNLEKSETQWYPWKSKFIHVHTKHIQTGYKKYY